MRAVVGVETAQLRAGHSALMGARSSCLISRVDGRGLGGSEAVGAFDRFAGYWVPGHEALMGSLTVLAGSLDVAADAYERRDAQDAGRFFGF